MLLLDLEYNLGATSRSCPLSIQLDPISFKSVLVDHDSVGEGSPTRSPSGESHIKLHTEAFGFVL